MLPVVFLPAWALKCFSPLTEAPLLRADVDWDYPNFSASLLTWPMKRQENENKWRHCGPDGWREGEEALGKKNAPFQVCSNLQPRTWKASLFFFFSFPWHHCCNKERTRQSNSLGDLWDGGNGETVWLDGMMTSVAISINIASVFPGNVAFAKQFYWDHSLSAHRT